MSPGVEPLTPSRTLSRFAEMAAIAHMWIALVPLRRRILLSSRRHAVDDRYADQTENTYSDPLLGHVQQVGADRQADDEYDVAGDVNPE